MLLYNRTYWLVIGPNNKFNPLCIILLFNLKHIKLYYLVTAIEINRQKKIMALILTY